MGTQSLQLTMSFLSCQASQYVPLGHPSSRRLHLPEQYRSGSHGDAELGQRNVPASSLRRNHFTKEKATGEDSCSWERGALLEGFLCSSPSATSSESRAETQRAPLFGKGTVTVNKDEEGKCPMSRAAEWRGHPCSWSCSPHAPGSFPCPSSYQGGHRRGAQGHRWCPTSPESSWEPRLRWGGRFGCAPLGLGRAFPALLSPQRAATSTTALSPGSCKGSRGTRRAKSGWCHRAHPSPRADTDSATAAIRPWTGILLSSSRRGSLAKQAAICLSGSFSEDATALRPPSLLSHPFAETVEALAPPSTVPANEQGTLTGVGDVALPQRAARGAGTPCAVHRPRLQPLPPGAHTGRSQPHLEQRCARRVGGW